MANFAYLKGWLTRFFANPERGQQIDGPSPSWNESDVALTDDRKLQISTVFSCIRLLTESIGSLPVCVYKRTANGREKDDKHPVCRLLYEPNPFMTGQEFLESMAMQLVGWGNAYALIAKNDKGVPMEAWPLASSKMTVERVGYERIIYRYNHERGPVEYDSGKILHIKGFGGDGIIGLSPLSYAAQAVGLTVAAEKYSAAFFKNGGRPSGVLQVEKPLNPQQRKDIREKYAPLTGGDVGNGNGLWVLDAFAKYQPISISPDDAQLLVTRQLQVAEIARIFRIPLFLLMEMEKSTSWGTGLEQQNLAFLTYTLRPYLTRIENAMDRWLFSEKERAQYYVEFNVEGLLRGDSTARATFYSTMVQNGLMTRNEVREKENMAPHAGADALTAQTNLAPVDMLGKIAEKQAEPEPAPTAKGAGLAITVQSGDWQVADALRESQRAQVEMADGVKNALTSLAKQEEVTAKRVAALVKEVGRPRKAVFDQEGNPIGTVPVDKLE